LIVPSLAIVVIGASAGGIDALSTILADLPENYPLPILVVIHLPPHKNSFLASLFAAKCHLRVKEADDKEPLLAGVVYFAPPDYHLLVEKNGYVSLSSDELINFSRPSIDVLFESAADIFGSTTLGVVLTGANNDGAQGLREIEAAGGIAIIQRVQEALAKEMPQAALKACKAARELSLSEIAKYLNEVGKKS
jgi:two-component system chemotaxis response regulator CheB